MTQTIERAKNNGTKIRAAIGVGIAAVAAIGLWSVSPKETIDPGSLRIGRSARAISKHMIEQNLRTEIQERDNFYDIAYQGTCETKSSGSSYQALGAVNKNLPRMLTGLGYNDPQSKRTTGILLSNEETTFDPESHENTGYDKYMLYLDKRSKGWMAHVVYFDGTNEARWAYPASVAEDPYYHAQTLSGEQLTKVLDQAEAHYGAVANPDAIGCTSPPTTF